MFGDNKDFATNIYNFFKAYDTHGYYSPSLKNKGIEEIVGHLSDLHMVRETIKDIEKIADEFDDHQLYVDEVKPLVNGLREIQGRLETEQSRRIVGDTNYEVKHAIHVGDKEIIFAEDMTADNSMNWFVGNYTSNVLIGEYADCQINDNYIEAMQEFTGRVNQQLEAMKSEIAQSKPETPVFTAEHCHPHDYGQSIDGKIIAIKAAILRPEYRRGSVQLVLIDGGNGARANPNGRAVYCYHLNDGTRTRFERHDVQGEVKAEFLPKWAAEKAAEIQTEKANPPQKKPMDREER